MMPSFNDNQRREVRKAAEQALRDGVFPCVEILMAEGETIIFHETFGRRESSPESPKLKKNSLFDLASLTKPLATAPAVLRLYESGVVGLEQKISDFIPELYHPGVGGATVKQLLTHTSGLPAWVNLHGTHFDKNRAWRKLIRIKPENKPNKAMVYSCPGFILLGEMIRRASGVSLSEFCRENLFAPLKLENLTFRPNISRPDIVPTDSCPLSGELLRGVVHDENARVFDEEGGNAGLFGTAEDIHLFCLALLAGGSLNGAEILSSATVKLMLKNHNPPFLEPRALGWDVHNGLEEYSSCGKLMPAGSVGHLGFTGTSLWMDPASGIIVVILSNRVNLGREANMPLMRSFRPKMHNLLLENIKNRFALVPRQGHL